MKKTISSKFFEIIFLIFFATQVGLLVYMNLFKMRSSLDYDFANMIYHYRQVITNGTLNLPDWFYTTTLELDTTMLFALPLSFVVKDIFLAVGLSNIVFISLYLMVVWGILKNVFGKNEKKYIFLCLSLLLTPYSFGMLDYCNMMFYAGAFYSVKVLIPLILIWIMQTITEKTSTPYVRITLLSILLIVTTLSTGSYVLLCGLLPIFILFIINTWKTGKLPSFRKNCIILGSGIILSILIGFMIRKLMNIEVGRYNLHLVTLDQAFDNARAAIHGLFKLFNATTFEQIKVTSIDGLAIVAKIALVILLSGISIRYTIQIFSKRNIDYTKSSLAILFCFNFALQFIVDTKFSPTSTIGEYRYLLIGTVPAMILLFIVLREFELNKNAFQKTILNLSYCLVVGLILSNNFMNTKKSIGSSEYAIQVTDYVQKYDIESVFVADDFILTSLCRSLDGTHQYATYLTSEHKIDLGVCSYYSSTDREFYGEKNAFVIPSTQDICQYMTDDNVSQYIYVGNVDKYDIYISDKLYFLDEK